MLAALATAQTEPAKPASASPAPSDAVVTLEEFSVRESALAGSGDILPTSRPVSSVFGLQTIIETPRSVTVLTPELMKQYDIQDFSDLSKIGAGTQQTNYYGVPGIPTIRGAKGSVYFNGMQRAYQRNEMPLSFGSLEGIDVVKGPAPSHYGAALVGGYVNLLPKSPYFDKQRGQLQLEVGQYDSIRSQFDVGGPVDLLGKPAAYRISVTGQLAESYYDKIGNDFFSIYGSVKVEIAKDVTLFTGGEYYKYKSNENAGWNRPTQDLIDNGSYVIGEPISIADSRWGGNANRGLLYGGAGFKYGPPVPTSSTALVVPASVVDAAVLSGKVTAGEVALMNNLSTVPGRAAAYADIPAGDLPFISQTASGYQYTPAYLAATGDRGVFTKKINGSQVLADDKDFANSENIFWFGDLESKRNPDRTFKNQTIVDYVKTEKRSSYGYAFDSEQLILEDKLSVSEDIETINTNVIYGGSVRYTNAWQLQDFWDEPFSRRDISTGQVSANSVVVAGDSPYGNFWNGGFGGQGGNVESTLFQYSAFVAANTKFTEKLQLDSSFLLTYASFEVGAPGPWARGLAPGALAATQDEHDKTYTSVSLSPKFEITKDLVAYVTVQKGTAADPLQGGPITGRASFAENEMAEVGLKGSLLNKTLFFGIAGYTWRQSSFNVRDNVSEELEGKGIEFESTYAPTKNFSIIGSVGYQFVTLEGNNTPFRAVPQSGQDWALNGGVLNDPFDVIGGPGPFGNPANNPDREYPGTPQTQVKLFAIYSFDNGFGVSGGPVWSDAYWHNYDHTIKLPSTIVVNASVFYKRPTWDLTLSVENLTDEDYFSGADPVFGAGTIITKAPEVNYKVSYTYKF